MTLFISFNSFTQNSKISFTTEEQKWINEHPIVYSSYDPEWKPIGFFDEKGKKFKSTNFKKLLIYIQNESIEKQHILLNNHFLNWMVNFAQIDDICLFGVKT